MYNYFIKAQLFNSFCVKSAVKSGAIHRRMDFSGQTFGAKITNFQFRKRSIIIPNWKRSLMMLNKAFWTQPNFYQKSKNYSSFENETIKSGKSIFVAFKL